VPRSVLAGVLAFAAGLVLYLVTMAPGLPPGHDSAELVTAAAVRGIPHPPGYPLYTLLGGVFIDVCGGDPAWAMNLFSVLCGALAVGLAGMAFSVLSGSSAAGLAAALAFAVARGPWRMAVGAEVFSLHLALVAGLLALAAFWRPASGGRRRLLVAAGALTFGLGLAHHQTVVLVLPGLAAFLWMARDGRPAGFTPWVGVALLAGLTPYAWLPWRAAQDPPLNWGDPDTPQRLWWTVTRQGYGGLKLSQVSGTHPAAGYHLEAWGRSLALWQFPFAGVAVGLAGASVGALRRRPEVILTGGLWLLAGPVWALVGAQPQGEGFLDMMERFYASSALGFAGLVALGLAEGLRSQRAGLRGLAQALCVALPILGLAVNGSACSERGQFQVPDSLAAVTFQVPSGALVVTGSDLTAGMFLYGSLVLKTDWEVVPVGLVASEWFLARLPAERAEALRHGGLGALLVRERGRGVPVFLDFLPAGMAGFFVPEGLLYRYLAPGEPIPRRSEASRRSLDILDRVARRGDYTWEPGRPFWTRHLVQTWAWAYQTAGEGLLQEDPTRAAEALEEARRMLRGDPARRAGLEGPS